MQTEVTGRPSTRLCPPNLLTLMRPKARTMNLFFIHSISRVQAGSADSLFESAAFSRLQVAKSKDDSTLRIWNFHF